MPSVSEHPHHRTRRVVFEQSPVRRVPVEFSVRWHKALADMGGSETAHARLEVSLVTIRLDGLTVPSLNFINPHRSQRLSLMQANKPKALPSGHKFRHRIDCGCALCRELGRAIVRGRDTSMPVIATLPRNLRIIPNLYPAHINHSLVLSLNHDDMSSRVIPEVDSKDTYIPQKPGKTRARLLVVEEVVEVFKYAAQNGFFALRNHPLSGMSLPTHDHWHLHPQSGFSMEYFYQLCGDKMLSGKKKAFRVTNALADIACIRGELSLHALAEKTVAAFNRLEQQGLVAVVLFNPLDGGQVFFSVLDPSVPQNHKSHLGCRIFLNNQDDAESHGGEKAPAVRGVINWRQLTSGIIPVRAIRSS